MYGFEKVKTALEFDKILTHIASLCVSSTGKARLENSSPFREADLLIKILRQVSDMRDIYQVEGGLPIWDFYDVRILLNKIEPSESYLDIDDFLKLQNFLELVNELSVFNKKLEEKYPFVRQVLNDLQPQHKLLNQLKFTFEPSARVFDNASPQLKAIRREMEGVNNEIHTKLDRIIRKNTEHIQESFLTLSDGRLVVPVREFSVTKIPGIVHGQSGSGATYYVEPMPVVDLNNQMQKLLSAEKKEIIKILKRLSDLVREEGLPLISNFKILNDLDVMQAKGRYANDINGRAPQMCEDFSWNLVSAKHPILLKMHPETTVPLNLTIGKSFRQVIISGPNAGGKTVALKTLGLLQLMFQSGFHIPAGEGTQMPLCRRIFTVIGDKQSIEQDLSTFSSHVNSLNDVLKNIEDEDLVLVDEIGSGTEPTGGAALAIAFIEHLNREGIVTVVTTHQNQLKTFASETSGIENAAMQFDIDSLSPLFSLETGIPGSSYTFDICRRLGLDEEVLQRAAAIEGTDSLKLDTLLADITQKSQKYKRLTDELSIKESKLNSLINLYNESSSDLKKKRRKYENEAKEEARSILNNINKEIETIIREIRESQADKQVIKKAKEQLKARRSELIDLGADVSKSSSVKLQELQIGQQVRALQYDIKGRISKIFKNKETVEIDRDGVKLTVKISEIEILEPDLAKKQGKKLKSEPAEHWGSVNITNELDLRGLTVDEALNEVARYLDLAVNSSWTEIRLIHGKGTGALRTAVQKYLSGLKSIQSYRPGKWGEGDAGVTVIYLK